MQAYVNVRCHLWSLDEGKRNWNTRRVCHLSVHCRTLSYKAREAYVHVMRVILGVCDGVCGCVVLYILTYALSAL